MGFIKKIFSFGQKEEEKKQEQNTLSPFEEEMRRRAAAEAAKAIKAEPDQETTQDPEIKRDDSMQKADEPKAAQKTLEQTVSAPASSTEAAPKAEKPKSKPPLEPKPKAVRQEKTLKAPTPPQPKPQPKPKPRPAPVQEPEAIIATTKTEVETLVAPVDVKKPDETIIPQASQKVTVQEKVEAKREETPPPAPIESDIAQKSWVMRLKSGLSRSSKQLGDSISTIFTKRKLDEDTLQDLEDVLIQADLGLETAMRITDSLSSGRYGKDISTAEVRSIMSDEITKVLEPVAQPLELDLSHKPHVILVVGVNGTGKTTTIGKLAAKLTQGGLKVMLAAGDTFRAAAIEQLHIWGERVKAPVISTKLGADAASLAFDAYEKAKEAGSDVLIIDTAGRLQNKAELMDELAKIVRVLGKHDADAPHTVLQTLDATTGQNALNQVDIFRNIAGVNGLVMTKLDGTARGGILVAIAAKHKLPVYFIGVGEGVDDLEPFKASDFAEAIAGTHS